MSISKCARRTIQNLRCQGVKFNIEVEVVRTVELHYQYIKLSGKEEVSFVAEIDHYGNVIEWGPALSLGTKKLNGTVYNADGEEV